MKLVHLRTLPLLLALALWLTGTAAVAQVPVIIAGEPAAPPLSQPGGGLCVTSKISTNPGTDFPTGPSTFNASLTAFIDSSSGSRVTSTLRTVFDLSNNNSAGQAQSYGDFTNSSPSCSIGGCGFFINDTTTSFASRFRGYLNVTAAMVGRPLHFGFYADDAVSFVIYDRNQTAYFILTRPPQLGSATWRTTNSVTFSIPGLYPVEIFYTAIVEHSALELSVLDGAFTDFELPANQLGSVSLKTSGFQLLTPAAFFQTEDGTSPFSNPDTCAQCSRQYANVPGNGGCGPGYYCNGAALCAPCTSSYFCGQSCAPCGGSTPVCAKLNSVVQCVQCTKDGDCRNGQKCNLDTFQCQECTASADCPRGRFCTEEGKCEACSTRTQCAGASCNCCSGPDSLKCAPRVPGEMPSCVECTQDSDCAAPKKCDTTNGRCVETLPECNTSERCGPECVTCPLERPFCLDGKVCVQCRSDIECGAGKFCLSGECSPCATDRRCGLRCEACADDTPFCAGDGTAVGSACVRCRDDGDCNGGTCDPATHTCSAGCQVTCGPGTYCDGSRCVACYANAHCPCGGACDPVRNVCTSTCDGSGDCSGAEYCTANQTCARGRRKPGVEPRGGGFCCDAPGRAGLPEAGLFVLLSLMILKRRPGFVRPGRGG